MLIDHRQRLCSGTRVERQRVREMKGLEPLVGSWGELPWWSFLGAFRALPRAGKNQQNHGLTLTLTL
jgi:hypothetical protein